ncbi:MAG: zinc ribbon domain-containing protein [SAR202 cluster bacterium]|jgi:putative FmdB family regulatory protein|nr:zinc ribbon domain-containing protein [Dehalococcoidia bacterium]MDP7231749.1 zinc ribbon domain-containing protein [Dehalococcoidia bacterium]MDP7613222.1 zinc ribbon domain-containing protein [Dehalococcoidia bacterium]MQG46755.1 zinc ribbon domain-containing protein [SAR202 cluster bacterium]|tara:strand:- start:76 stop:381 length:306 start_codon:yes stop_codon:yes gene_type:complete
MPTYEYQCVKGCNFELVKAFSDEAPVSCPDCGSNAERQFSIPSIIYKGSGFYSTDYGSSKSRNTDARDSQAESSKQDKSDKTKNKKNSTKKKETTPKNQKE